jgi:hypothetical protein
MWDSYTRIQPNIQNKWTTCTSKPSGKSSKLITNQQEFYQCKKTELLEEDLCIWVKSELGVKIWSHQTTQFQIRGLLW